MDNLAQEVNTSVTLSDALPPSCCWPRSSRRRRRRCGHGADAVPAVVGNETLNASRRVDSSRVVVQQHLKDD